MTVDSTNIEMSVRNMLRSPIKKPLREKEAGVRGRKDQEVSTCSLSLAMIGGLKTAARQPCDVRTNAARFIPHQVRSINSSVCLT